MSELLQNIDIMEFLNAIWTIILAPILSFVGKQVYDYLKSKKLDKYGKILYEEVSKAVKSVYQTTVERLKDTEDWTPEFQEEVKEMAKIKAIQALPNFVHDMLLAANEDFYEYLDNLVEAAIYDCKYGK